MKPQHLAIIMDGNGRWAQARRLPRTAGHKQGVEALKKTIRLAQEAGIPYLTVFGFSSENWGRPAEEVSFLMGLMRSYISEELEELVRNEIRVEMIGDRSRLPADIVEKIARAEERTKGFSKLRIAIALSYGGRDDILQAVRELVRKAAGGGLDAESFSAAVFEEHLQTRGFPDPDLVIRTSGEKRLSNFLLWQTAYSEIFFTDTLWPDFSEKDFNAALADFASRTRRYGGLS